jgi:PKD repeat protein
MKKKFLSLAGILSAFVLFGFSAIASPAGQIEGGDIYRVKNVTTNGEFMDPASGTCGNTFQFKVRIHNPGPDILSNVKVKATLPTTEATSHSSQATITADNANPASTTDTAGVKLDKTATLKYINGSTELLDANGSKLSTLGDTIFTTGVSIGNVGVSVQQKRFVQFSVKADCYVEPPKPQALTCDDLTLTIVNKDNREVSAKVTGTASNTTISGYKIDFGDSTVVNQQTANHTYADYGKYTVKGYVTGLVDGSSKTVTSAACAKSVEFTKPVEPPKPQALTCDNLKLTILDKEKREVEAKVTGTAENTTISGYKIDFGDESAAATTQTAKHTYAEYGKFTVTGYVTAKVDGQDKTVSGPGCVQHVEFTKPVVPVEQNLVCDALEVSVINTEKREVRANVVGTATNTTISSYKIDFGDGTIVNEQTAAHTYADYGTFKLVGHVTGMVDGKEKTVSSVNCEKSVTLTKPVPPVEPPVTPPTEPEEPGKGEPETLPDTGAGSAIGLFTGVSMLGAIGHRMWISRRF